jgi:autophagy-related protein 16
MIATGSQDKKLNLYDSRTGSLTRSLAGSGLGITSIEFSEANDLVLGSSADNSIKLWNLATARVAHSLTGHIGKVFSACFANGKVVSGSHDRMIKIWDLQKGYCTKTLFTLSSCNDLVSLDYEGMEHHSNAKEMSSLADTWTLTFGYGTRGPGISSRKSVQTADK